MRQSSLFGNKLQLYAAGTTVAILIGSSAVGDGGQPDDRHSQLQTKPRAIPYQLTDSRREVAIAGAWRRVEIALEDVVANSAVRSRYTVPQRASQRFLGFIEGLLRVSLPDSFLQNILHAEMTWTGYIRFPIQRYSPWSPRQREGGVLPSEMPAFHVTVHDGRVVVRMGTGNFPTLGNDGAVTLPAELSQALLANSNNGFVPISSALFYQNRVFLAITNRDQPGGTVYCLPASGADILWSQPVADYAGPSYRGSGDWFTEMRVREREVILFHCSESSFGIEAISLDGDSVFAFTSLKSDDE